MFNLYKNLSPAIVAEIFRARRNNYHFRNFFFYILRQNFLTFSRVWEFIQLRTENMELSPKYPW